MSFPRSVETLIQTASLSCRNCGAGWLFYFGARRREADSRIVGRLKRVSTRDRPSIGPIAIQARRAATSSAGVREAPGCIAVSLEGLKGRYKIVANIGLWHLVGADAARSTQLTAVKDSSSFQPLPEPVRWESPEKLREIGGRS